MASNIANALFPIELISKLCALGHCEYFFDRPNVYFSSIYVTIVWFIYFFIICSLQYNMIWISFKHNVGFVLYNSHLCTTASLIICGMYYKRVRYSITQTTKCLKIFIRHNYCQMYKQCLQQISIINDTLDGFHIPNEYEYLRKKAVRIIIRWILISLGLNGIQTVWYFSKAAGMKIYLAPFVINHTIHVNNLIDVLYETLIWYIASIFEKINKYILHLSKSTTVASRKFQHCSLIDTVQHKYTLSTIMQIHLDLCNICHKLHKLFQLPLTTGMVANLVLAIGYIYFQYLHTIKLYQNQLCILPDAIATVITLAFFIWRVIYLNISIENCCKKADNTKYMLHILSGCTNNPERQEEISQFLLQVIHKKLRLSAMGLFHFGHRFLCTYFIVITNYAITYIQFNIT